MLKHTSLLIFIFLLSSCYLSLSHARIKASCDCGYSVELSGLNGKYLNNPDSSYSLLSQIYTKKIKKEMINDSLILDLTFRNSEIEIKGIVKDSVVFIKYQKGIWNGKQFAVSTDIKVIGIPPVYFFTGKYKTYIGLSTDGALKISSGFSEFGMILFFAARDEGCYCRTFQKKSG